MAYNNALVAGKLRRWERYLDRFRLPAWEEIPDIGLYMEQVVALLREYLDYLPPELKEEEAVTAAATYSGRFSRPSILKLATPSASSSRSRSVSVRSFRERAYSRPWLVKSKRQGWAQRPRLPLLSPSRLLK